MQAPSWIVVCFLAALVLATTTGPAAAEEMGPTVDVRVVRADVVDLDRDGFLDDVVLHVSFEVQSCDGGSFELVIRLTLPSGAIRETDAEVSFNGSGVLFKTFALIDSAPEPGWYILQLFAEFEGHERSAEPYRFDPAGGSVGPSGD